MSSDFESSPLKRNQTHPYDASRYAALPAVSSATSYRNEMALEAILCNLQKIFKIKQATLCQTFTCTIPG